MDPAVATVIVASITTIGGLVGVAIKEFKNMQRRNTSDHGAVMNKLDAVQEGVNNVSERLTDHIDWHLKK